jgi:hypothetical protein
VTKGVTSVRSAVTNLRQYSYTIDHMSFCEAVHAEFIRTYVGECYAVDNVSCMECCH